MTDAQLEQAGECQGQSQTGDQASSPQHLANQLLGSYRDKLRAIDVRVLSLFGERLKICRDVARVKAANQIPMMQPAQIEAVRERYRRAGANAGLPTQFTESLFALSLETACRIEDEVIEAIKDREDISGVIDATRQNVPEDTCTKNASDTKGAVARRGTGTPNFITLGPPGSCHERATRRYVEATGLRDETRVTLVDDLLVAMEELNVGNDSDFIVQCSAHPDVHHVTERRYGEIHVLDTFMCPSRPIVIVARHDVTCPRTIGVPHAAVGYLEGEDWERVVLETTKPVVARRLLEGAYDAGLTNYEQLEIHRKELRMLRYLGEVQTTWLVYGRGERANGDMVLSSGAGDFWKTIEEGRWTR